MIIRPYECPVPDDKTCHRQPAAPPHTQLVHMPWRYRLRAVQSDSVCIFGFKANRCLRIRNGAEQMPAM